MRIVKKKPPVAKLTLYDIARIAGVSKTTVSRVLINAPDIAEETRARIRKVMAEHGYRPSRFAQGLAGGKSGLIAVVMPGMFSGYYAEVLKGVDLVAHGAGTRIIASIAHSEDEYYSMVTEYAQPGRVDGMVLVAPRLDLLRRPAPEFPVPVVLVSARALRNGQGWDRLDTVTVDNARAVQDALGHLAAQGCGQVVCLAAAADSYDARERRQAIADYARANPAPAIHLLTAGLTSDEAVAVLRAHRAAGGACDAVLAHNDDMAIGVVKALREQGVSVPDTIAVVGCDDEHAAGIMGLTTLHMPMVELGEEAARLMFARMARRTGAPPAPRCSTLGMPLVVRATSVREVR